jgi:hypothetical protein
LIYSCTDSPTEKIKKPEDTLNVPKPNFDFEEWTKKYNDKDELMYEEPLGGFWTSLNRLRLLGGPVTTERTTESYHGKYAARLETKLFGSFIITGMLLSGEFDPVKYSDKANFVNEGQPFFERVADFRGFYKYFGIDNDSASVYIGLTKYNKQLNKKDTIAEASEILSNCNEYKMFDLKLNYYKDIQPDTIKIAIISSAGGRNFGDSSTARVGSVLFIDELSLELLNGKIIKINTGVK